MILTCGSLHGQILESLSIVLADPRSLAKEDEVDRLISACPPVPVDSGFGIFTRKEAPDRLGTMTPRNLEAISALANYVCCMHDSELKKHQIICQLIAYVRYLPAFEWYEPIIREDDEPASIALVDKATYMLASSLQEIAYKNPKLSANIMSVLWGLARRIIGLVNEEDASYIVSFVLPAYAGLLRSFQLSRFIFAPEQLASICTNTRGLINNTVLDSVRKAVKHCLAHSTTTDKSQRVLRTYWDAHMPLSGNRMIYDLLIIWRNTLVRIISRSDVTTSSSASIQSSLTQEDSSRRFHPKFENLYLTTEIEEAWSFLMESTQREYNNNIVEQQDSSGHLSPSMTLGAYSRQQQHMNNAIKQIDDDMAQILSNIFIISLGYYADAKRYFLENHKAGKKPDKDGYMHEIMGLSLHVAALASVYLGQVDDTLINHIDEGLFDHILGQENNPWLSIAALDASALIAINFPHKTPIMIQKIRQFLVTADFTFLNTTYHSSSKKITIRQYVIVRLAQCIQSRPVTQRSQAATSTLYALLNEMARYDDENQQEVTTNAEKQSGESLAERQRQQLAVIVGIAVYLKNDEITAQAFTMVLLRRSLLSAPSTSFIMDQLVQLALVSPQSVFVDIINLFALLHRESLTLSKNMEVNESLLNTVLKSQLDLARNLNKRPEYYHIYLCNILTLFIENGILIEHMIADQAKKKDLKIKKGVIEEDSLVSGIPLKARLGRLLPVLNALLSHSDFNPHIDTDKETVVLFRNAWLQCIYFEFTTESLWEKEWRESMMGIAKKSPALLIESTTDHLESDLEYNTVLSAGDISPSLAANARQTLQGVLVGSLYDIKYMSFAQVIFTLSIYHVETMRGQSGDCSYILRYFMSEAIMTNTHLDHCLQTIMERVVDIFIRDALQKSAVQLLEEEIYFQMRELLICCCHRLRRVHLLALKITNRVINTFPQIFAKKGLVTLLLELVQLTWLSCEAEYRDEYTPVFYFTSKRAGITLELGDSYSYRRELCTSLYDHARKWLQISMDLSPLEVTNLLQDYLAEFNQFDCGMPIDAIHLGRSLALDIGKNAAKNHLTVDFVPKVPTVEPDDASDFVYGFTSRRYYTGEINGMSYIAALDRNQDKLPGTNTHSNCNEDQEIFGTKVLQEMFEDVKNNKMVSVHRLHQTMLRTAAAIVSIKEIHPDLISYLVRIPAQIFTAESIDIATNVWNWVLVQRPDVEKRLMVEMLNMWRWSHRHRKGLFSPLLSYKDPFDSIMTYTPSKPSARQETEKKASALFVPHITWILFLQSRLNSICHYDKHIMCLFVRLLEETFRNTRLMSTHSLSRQPRFYLVLLGFRILQSYRMEAVAEHKFRTLVYDSAFCWFSQSPKWHYGSRKSYILQEYKLLNDVYSAVSRDIPRLAHVLTSSPLRSSNSQVAAGLYKFVDDQTKDDIIKNHISKKKLLLLFLESELSTLSVWCNPLNDIGHGHPPTFMGTVEKTMTNDDLWKKVIRFAWEISPELAIQLKGRFMQPVVYKELHQLIANNTLDVVRLPEALVLLLRDGIQPDAKLDLKHLQYWAPVSPITAANYFLPAFKGNSNILQYAMRSLEYYPVDLVFFYVPQIVQALRYDEYGYVEKYIMEAGQESQLFAHQIIWNMQANYYVDADKGCEKPDPMKSTLERIVEKLVDSFTGKDRKFYEREFSFFNKVTAISGYLKEYIKLGQSEKKPKQKERLDQEMSKIEVEKGVYLPSNPDGEVVDIERKSGKPLQSHAKAPFMATFKIKKKEKEILLSAIFKVGDDCRQDVLALQLIAIFKNIFTSIGLDLYLFPYRVVATAPGQGVIDVIKNAISRDQLGREKVNNMYDYFVAKYGEPDTVSFQKARTSFVQSLAAYSVLSYLLQFKDRHNGNIMLDEEGHILHIDFGFIFDIAPGGITFESSPFKLTTEMIQVMGGGSDEQAFKQFSELVVKAYLASRPFADQICQTVTLMLESGLPCFKGETIRRMRIRFQLDKSERVAANFIMMRIRDSFENQRTVMYDYFQKLTNGIPY